MPYEKEVSELTGRMRETGEKLRGKHFIYWPTGEEEKTIPEVELRREEHVIINVMNSKFLIRGVGSPPDIPASMQIMPASSQPGGRKQGIWTGSGEEVRHWPYGVNVGIGKLHIATLVVPKEEL